MTKYECMVCNKKWRIEDDKPADGISDGICAPCLKENRIPVYRNKQLAEGNFDCFGKAIDFCDQGGCKYRRLCLA